MAYFIQTLFLIFKVILYSRFLNFLQFWKIVIIIRKKCHTCNTFLNRKPNNGQNFSIFLSWVGHKAFFIENNGNIAYFSQLFSKTGKLKLLCFLFFQCPFTVVSCILRCQLVVSYRTVSYKKELRVGSQEYIGISSRTKCKYCSW